MITDETALKTVLDEKAKMGFVLTDVHFFCLQKSQERRRSSVSVSFHSTETFLTQNFKTPVFFFPSHRTDREMAECLSKQLSPKHGRNSNSLGKSSGKGESLDKMPRWSDA